MTVKLHGAFKNLEVFKQNQMALREHLLRTKFAAGLMPLDKKVGTVLMIFDADATKYLADNLQTTSAPIARRLFDKPNLDFFVQKFNNVRLSLVIEG